MTEGMVKMDGASKDILAERIENLKALIPEAFADGKIDFDSLRAALGDAVDTSKANYSFTWNGKNEARAFAFAKSMGTLRPCKEESKDWDTTKNLYIEGDNLEVLKLLQGAYHGRVKMIYIDPPYNTGHDFVYEDDFSDSIENYKEKTGQTDSEGRLLRANPETSGRYHTDWLNMMFPRLLLARNLLRDDGVIFISIDDNEVTNLRKVCDEVFGENNFIAQFTWAAGRKNDSKHVSVSHEYIVAYFKNEQYITDRKIIWRERKQGLDDIYAAYDSFRKQYGADNTAVEKALKTWYSALPDGHPAKDHSHYNKVDDKGVFFASDISWPGGGGPKYEILHPVTQKPVTVPSRGWITNPETMKQWVAEGRVHFGEDESAVPTIKSYLREHETGVPYSVFYKDGRAASKRLKTLLGDKVFENPKDEDIIKRLIEFSGTGKDDVVVDFFSGSGTTAHALMLAEAEKCFGRRFILVQLPAIIDPEKTQGDKAKKIARNAVTFLDSLNAKHTICEIGKERIRRAGKKIAATAPGLDVGFKVFKLDTSNLIPWNPNPEDLEHDLFAVVENAVKGRTADDLLYEILLKCNLPLTLPIEEQKVGANTISVVGEGKLMVCLDKTIPVSVAEEMVRLRDEVYKPSDMQVVFRDNGFSDKDKTNAIMTLKQAGVEDKAIMTI